MESTSLTLDDLLKLAVAKLKAMSPEEKEAMSKAQRKGWVRAELEWAKDFREGKCRYD